MIWIYNVCIFFVALVACCDSRWFDKAKDSLMLNAGLWEAFFSTSLPWKTMPWRSRRVLASSSGHCVKFQFWEINSFTVIMLEIMLVLEVPPVKHHHHIKWVNIWIPGDKLSRSFKQVIWCRHAQNTWTVHLYQRRWHLQLRWSCHRISFKTDMTAVLLRIFWRLRRGWAFWTRDSSHSAAA